MPRVPTYENLTVTPTTVPQAYARTPDFHPELVGAQARETGQAMMQAGGELGKVAMDMAVDFNKTRVEEATLQLRETARRLQYGQQTLSGQTDPGQPVGYSQLKGIDALQRPDNKPLAQEYGDLLDQHISKISDGLGNDAQKQAFSTYARGFSAGFQDDVWRHTFAEQRTYQTSVATGLMDEALNTLKDNYTNPVAVQGAVDQVRTQANRLGQLKGLSDPEIRMESLKAISNAHDTVIKSFLANNDPIGAAKYYDAHAKDMRTDESLGVMPHIREGLAIQQGLTAANYAINKSLPPGPGQNLYQGLLPVEGGVDKNGNFLTSPKGAIGPSQMLLTTGPEAAKVAGVPWDEQKFRTDPAYNNLLGMAWINDLTRKFGGDPEKGYAAYNAGETDTRNAIAKAEKNGGKWLDYLPQETQAYVPKAMGNFQKLSAGGPRKIDPLQADSIVREQVGNNPQSLKYAREEVAKQIKLMNDSIEQTEQHNFSVAVDWMVQNNKPLAQAPFDLRSSVPRDKWASAQSAADAVMNGKTDWDKYMDISSQISTDPMAFRSRDLTLDKPYLAAPQYKQFIDLQAKMNDPQQAPQIADLSAQISAAALSLGLNVDKQKQGRFESVVRDAIEAESQGRKLNYKERQTIINRLMLPVDSGHWYSPNMLMWETIGTADEGKKPDVISTDQRKRIAAQLTKDGIAVTDANIKQRFKEIYGIQ